MIMTAIICMAVSFALLLAMLFLMAKEDATIASLVGFCILSMWMGIVMFWLTHYGVE